MYVIAQESGQKRYYEGEERILWQQQCLHMLTTKLLYGRIEFFSFSTGQRMKSQKNAAHKHKYYY